MYSSFLHKFMKIHVEEIIFRTKWATCSDSANGTMTRAERARLSAPIQNVSRLHPTPHLPSAPFFSILPRPPKRSFTNLRNLACSVTFVKGGWSAVAPNFVFLCFTPFFTLRNLDRARRPTTFVVLNLRFGWCVSVRIALARNRERSRVVRGRLYCEARPRQTAYFLSALSIRPSGLGTVSRISA